MRAHQEKGGGVGFLCGFFGCLLVLLLLRSSLHFVYVAVLKCINIYCNTYVCFT